MKLHEVHEVGTEQIITHNRYQLHDQQYESHYDFTLSTSPWAGDQLND